MKNFIKTYWKQERYRTLLRKILENWKRLAIASGCMMLFAITTSVSIYLIKPALDDIFVNKNTVLLSMIPIAVIILYVLRGFAMYGQEYLMDYIGEYIIKFLRVELYNSIQDMPISFFQKEKTGTLMSRIIYDVGTLKSMVSATFTSSIRDFFTIIFLIGLIFYMDWKMALFASIILPFISWPLAKFGKLVRGASTTMQETMGDMSAFLHESFAGNKIVKAFGMENYEKARFEKKADKFFRVELKEIIAKSISSPVMETLGGFGIAFVIWYGGFQVINGKSTVGTFFAFIAAVISLYDPVKKLTRTNNAIQEGIAATNRVFDIIEAKSDISEIENPVTIKHGFHSVKFKNVFFKYNEQESKENMVLNDINIEVKPGEVLALVGMSGGGKTSFVNLIPRFFNVTKGAIYFDDIDIKNATIKSLRQQIAIVTQEPILFNDTVRNNIAYGNVNATDEEIIKAAKAAYAYDFIQGFPNKFETSIGELGGRLSGGEKQRLCIARALLKDAPILILDEATSALDTEAEMIVQKALENLMKGRTTFVIAHRLSTISYADRIIVLSKGRIIEQGKHQELLEKQGAYFKLHNMQFDKMGKKE